MKPRKDGLRIAWTREAETLPRERASSGINDPLRKLQHIAYKERVVRECCNEALQSDLYRNPNLSLIAEEFVRKDHPRNLAPRWSV